MIALESRLTKGDMLYSPIQRFLNHRIANAEVPQASHCKRIVPGGAELLHFSS